MTKTRPLAFLLVLFCFFVSGVAGLVYQIVWTRYLALFLGHTSYSIVAVLVAFMGGLALGNAWLGAKADRASRPLAFYALLEIAIGLYALAFPAYYALCHNGFIHLAREWEAGGVVLLAMKFAFSLLAILLPTVMMGATFPILTRFVTGSLGELRERVAGLYCANSAGAVAGCLVADFWWIPNLGLEMTVWFGAALNLAVGLVAIVLSWAIREGKVHAAADTASAGRGLEQFSERELKLSIAVIGISGFVAMLYEVAWTRVLALALGSSTHAFSIMLITFISGITVGSWIVYRWKTLRNTVAALAWTEIGLAAAVLVSMSFYDLLPYWFVKLADLLTRSERAYPVYEFLQLLICFSVMFVPTILLGMTLPLASRIGTVELARAGRGVGRVFAVNTFGTVLGTALTGLWLMPTLGLARTFALGVALNAAAGLALLFHRRIRSWGLALACLTVGTLAVTWSAGRILDRNWKHTLSLGAWRLAEAPENLASYRGLAAGQTLKYYRDGASATVSVVSQRELGPDHLTLKVNGKPDAGTQGDVPTQLLLGHIPMFLRPDAAHVLVVGLGSGMTCGAVARHPTLKRLDVVEISPEVAEAAREFGPYNHDVLDDQRVHVVVEDAKSFLQMTDQRYEVIISEPSNPWMAGVAGVFTREFYASCARRLSSRGLMVQWIHLNETSDLALDTVLATLASVFPHLGVWQGAAKDLLLIGSLEPVTPDLDEIAGRFNVASVRGDLARFGVTSLPALLACELISAENGPHIFSRDATLHSDLYPVLEYIAQRSFFVRSRAERWRTFDERASPRPSTLLGKHLLEHRMEETDLQPFVTSYLSHRLFPAPLLRSLLSRWASEFPNSNLPIQMLVLLAEPADASEAQALRLSPLRSTILDRAAEDPELLRSYVSFAMEKYRSQRSVFFVPAREELVGWLERLIQTDAARGAIYQTCLAELAWDHGDDAACFRLGERAFSLDAMKSPSDLEPAAPADVLARMIETLWRAAKLDEAVALCERADRAGYLRVDSPLDRARLEMICRKVRSAARR